MAVPCLWSTQYTCLFSPHPQASDGGESCDSPRLKYFSTYDLRGWIPWAGKRRSETVLSYSTGTEVPLLTRSKLNVPKCEVKAVSHSACPWVHYAAVCTDSPHHRTAAGVIWRHYMVESSSIKMGFWPHSALLLKYRRENIVSPYLSLPNLLRISFRVRNSKLQVWNLNGGDPLAERK